MAKVQYLLSDFIYLYIYIYTYSIHFHVKYKYICINLHLYINIRIESESHDLEFYDYNPSVDNQAQIISREEVKPAHEKVSVRG